MRHQVILAGFGGQGIMTMGTILATAGMKEGLNVTWIPSYGAEQRGGTANCTVVIADEMIASPIVDHPGILAAMNPPSLDKFEPRAIPGGEVFVNSSLVTRELERSDFNAHLVPASGMAEEIGNIRVANMVMLGAMVARTGMVELSSLEKAIREVTGKRPELLELNLKAIQAGSSFKS